MPCRANSRLPTLSGPYSKRVAKMSRLPIRLYGAAAEVADLGREGEGGELGDGARDLVTDLVADEDAPLESLGQWSGDSVGREGGHAQPAFRTAVVPWSSSREDG